MSNAITGPGVLLKLGDGGGTEVFTTVAEVKGIKFSGFKASVEDVSNQSSPNNIKEKKPSQLDPGQVTFDCNFLPTDGTQNGTTGLMAAWKNRRIANWKLVFPDGLTTTWNFAGFVANIPLDLPDQGVLRMSGVTIEITSLPTGI